MVFQVYWVLLGDFGVGEVDWAVCGCSCGDFCVNL